MSASTIIDNLRLSRLGGAQAISTARGHRGNKELQGARQRHLHGRRQHPAPSGPVCFVGTLGDLLRGGAHYAPNENIEPVSGWIAWPLSFRTPPSPQAAKDDARRERAQRLKAILAASRGTKPFALPQAQLPPANTDSEEQQQQAAQKQEQEQSHVELVNALSNAVPLFSGPPAAPSGSTTAATGTTRNSENTGDEDINTVPEAEEVILVLPWLFVAAGKLDFKGSEFMASKLALSRLQILDLSRLLGSAGATIPQVLGEGVAWVGATPLPTPTVAAAATLHRLAHRRGGPLAPLPLVGGSAVVLTHRPEEVDAAAKVLALYFHLYSGMDARDAANAAGGALRCAAPPISALEAGVEEMAACGQGWLQRIILEWRYGGGRVEATGDPVGGWERLVPLAFDVQHRRWRVQLWGHPPGPCSYKFIVDGRWCTDMAAPSEVDQWGNTNNLIYVPGCFQVGAAARAAAASDGMAASPCPKYDFQGDEGMLQEEGEREGETEAELSGGGGVTTATAALVSESQDDSAWADSFKPEERLRLARFGAGILAYYAKSSTVHRSLLS